MEHSFFLKTRIVIGRVILAMAARESKTIGEYILQESKHFLIVLGVTLGFVLIVGCIKIILDRRRARRKPKILPTLPEDPEEAEVIRNSRSSIRRWRGLVATSILISIALLSIRRGPIDITSYPLRNNVFYVVADSFYYVLTSSRDNLKMVPPKEFTATLNRDNPPNIVTIFMESTGTYVHSSYNEKARTTPFLKSLAEKHTIGKRFYTAMPITTRSHISWLCGYYPKDDPDVQYEQIAAEHMCLPKILQQSGYEASGYQTGASNLDKRDIVYRHTGFQNIFGESEFLKYYGSMEKLNLFGYDDKNLVNFSMNWLDNHLHTSKAPFYMSYATIGTHHPYILPSWYHNQTVDLDYPGASMDSDAVDERKTVYYADQEVIKPLMAEFEKRGLLNNTLFIITSDHGIAVGQHGKYIDLNVEYDECFSIPFLAMIPEVDEPFQLDGLHSNLDLKPTIVKYLNISIEPNVEFMGTPINLIPSREEHENHKIVDEGHKTLYGQCVFPDFCLVARNKKWKLIDYRLEDTVFALYDIENDPLETINLAEGKTLDHLPSEGKKLYKELHKMRDANEEFYQSLVEQSTE